MLSQHTGSSVVYYNFIIAPKVGENHTLPDYKRDRQLQDDAGDALYCENQTDPVLPV